MSGNKHLAETLHHKSKSAKSPQGDTALVPARLHWKRKRIFQWARADSEVRYLQNERAAVIANRAHWVNTSARTRWTGEELLTKNNEVKKYHKWKEISNVCSGQSATIAVFACLCCWSWCCWESLGPEKRDMGAPGWWDSFNADSRNIRTLLLVAVRVWKGAAACRATPSQHSPNSGPSNLWIMD